MQHILLSESDLAPFHPADDLGSRAHALLQQQKQSWEMLKGGYESLAAVQTRMLEFDGFNIMLQFNPRRITSSTAKVDPKSIAERKCFLCPANLPPQQRGLLFQNDYLVLCNPFPIFLEHFTIPHKDHTPQQIDHSFGVMLGLAKAMQSRYTIFYNGPKCGASAPDHLHFQAGDKNFMLIDQEYDRVKKQLGEELLQMKSLKIFTIDRYLRTIISMESNDAGVLLKAFGAYFQAARNLCPSAEEPMMNILCSFQNDAWRVVIFPRVKHRPSFFFEEGEKKILLSPASVDFGGICITPIEKDFQQLTKDHLIQMFDEVCLKGDGFKKLCWEFKSILGQ